MIPELLERFTLVLRCGDGGGGSGGGGSGDGADGPTGQASTAGPNGDAAAAAAAAAAGAPGVGGVSAGASETGGAVGGPGGMADASIGQGPAAGGGADSYVAPSAVLGPTKPNTEAATPGNNATQTKSTRKSRKGASFDNAVLGVPGLLGVRSNSLF